MKDKRDWSELFADIERFSGEMGAPCTYVPSESRSPDYVYLDHVQRGYYFHWRSRLSEGELLKGDDGYAWLRMTEIVNSDMDPVAAMKELDLMRGCVINNKHVLNKVMVDVALLNGLPIPSLSLLPWESRHWMAACHRFSSPPDQITDFEAGRLIGHFIPSYTRKDDRLERFERLLNLVLLRVDRNLKMTTGNGIVETFGDRVCEPVDLFEGIPYSKDRRCDVTYISLDNTRFRKFLQGAVRYCERLQSGDGSIRSTSEFDKNMRKIADDAYEDMQKGRGDDVRGPKEQENVKIVRVSDRERMLQEMGESLSTTPVSEGVIVTDYRSMSNLPPNSLRDEVERYWDVGSRGERRYIPSGMMRPSYTLMDTEQLEYYLHWRDMARNGVYLDTDRGYLWLFLTETINMSRDHDQTVFLLGDMVSHYERGVYPISPLCVTYQDYILVNDVTVCDSDRVHSGILDGMLFQSMLRGDVGTITNPRMFLEASSMSRDSLRADFDSDCAAITSLVLRAVDESISEGIVRGFGLIMEHEYEAYKDLSYWGDRRTSMKVSFPDLQRNRYFRTDLTDLLKDVVRAVRKHKGKKNNRIMHENLFGMPIKGIIEQAVEGWFSSGQKASAPKERIKVILDREAVKDAESALDEVTEMMRIDDDDAEPAGGMEVDDLASSGPGFTVLQKEYIRLLMDGADTRAFLERNRTTAGLMEESVNTMAMDVLGDTVIDDGEIVEDYIEELRRMLE